MTPAKVQMKILKSLERAKKNEQDLNELYMKQRIGTPVLFGDTIQLKHVRSGKYVTVNVNKFQEHQIYLTESRRLHVMEESLVPLLRNHVLSPPILRRG